MLFRFKKEEFDIISTEVGAALRIATDRERDALLDGLLREAHSAKDLNSYLHRVAAFLSRFMRAEGVSIFVWDETAQRLQLAATTGLMGDTPKRKVFYRPGEGLTGRVFSEGDFIVSEESFEKEPRKGLSPKFVEKTTVKPDSFLAIPILKLERPTRDNASDRRTPIGVVRCANKLAYVGDVGDAFSPADVQSLEHAGKIIAPYVELLQEENRRVSLLNRISHEILSPIISIRGTAEYITNKKASISAPQLFSLVSDVSVHANILRMLCGGINIINTTAAGLQQYNCSRIKLLDDVVSPCIDMIKPLARALGLRFDSIRASGPKDLAAESDKLGLQQVIFNLLTNALKYHRRDVPNEFQVDVICEQQKDGLRTITVSDHGIGIDPTEAELIFDYGYRGRETDRLDAKGIGLGLFICRTVVSALQGKLDLVRLADPTTFRLTLSEGLF